MSRAVLISVVGLATAAAALGLAMSLGSDDDARRAAALPLPALQAGPQPRVAAVLPAFDVVRIGETGNAVLAGRALPKAELVLLDGEHELGRVQADERGEWVFVPALPMAPGARALTVEAHNPDGGIVRSASPVIVAVPENAAEPAAPDGGARPMAAPDGAAEPVTVDLVDRDDSGRLFMGGRAQPGDLIHVYMDNSFLGRVQADGEGGWRLAIKAVQGHTLRADLVNDGGKVRARLEVPLEPEQTQAAVPPVPAMAQQTSKDRMRDPDHIYPGQVFLVPKR